MKGVTLTVIFTGDIDESEVESMVECVSDRESVETVTVERIETLD